MESVCRMKSILFLLALLSFFQGFSQKQTPEQEIHAQLGVAFKLIFSNPDEAFKQLTALEKKTAIRKDTLHGIALNNKGVFYGVTFQPDSALSYFKRALLYFPKEHKRYPGILSNSAIVYKKTGNYDEALKYLNKALQIAVKQDNKRNIANIYGELASTHSSLQSYKSATKYLLKAIDLMEKYTPDDRNALATEKQKLANLYLKTANDVFAEKLYAEAKVIFKELNRLDSYYLTIASEADLQIYKKQPQKALALLEEAEKGLKPFNNAELNVFVASLKAKAYLLLNNTTKIKQVYEEAIKYGIEKEQILGFYVWIEYGKYLVDNGNYAAFSKMYTSYSNNSAFQSLLQKSSVEMKMNYYELLGKYASYTNNNALGFSALQKALQYKDAFNEHFKVAEISEIQLRYQDIIQQKENLLLQDRLNRERLKNIIISVSAIIILILLLIAYSGYKIQKKLSKKTIKNFKLEKQMLDSNLKIAKELNELKESTIKQQEQDLIATSIEKLRLKEKLEALSNEIELGNLPKVKAELKRMQKNESYWTDLIEKFRRLNPKFIESLLESCPSLSKSEVEFCALVKMNLSYKEIAELLKIEHDSVFTKKYRIVKKLNLNHDTDFYSWIQKIR